MLNTISITQFNLLAPIWISDMYKLLPCYSVYIEPDRLQKTLRYIRTSLPITDIYCFAEVLGTEIEIIKEMFPEYMVGFSPNSENYWNNWLSPNSKTQSNGTCILVSLNRFSSINFKSIPFHTGCTSAMIRCFDNYTGRTLNIASVHFDTEETKYFEAEELLELFDDYDINDIDIIAGDFNFTNVDMFIEDGFNETIKSAISTVPLIADRQGKLDHTFVRGQNISSIFGYINSITLDTEPGLLAVAKRMCETVNVNHSDHYASTSYINFY